MVRAASQSDNTKSDRQQASKIALVGFGTVGSAVARLLSARAGEPALELTHICNRQVKRKKVNWVSDRICWTDDIQEVLRSDVQVVLELIGGLRPAYDWVRQALEAGKSVVTANKQLIARHGSELLELARRNRQQLAFGACVGGGIPVLSGLSQGLAGDRLFKISGILNGTCNYILTRIEAGASFAEALKEAQVAGFAEADPTEDIDGFDARAKLVILVRVGLKAEVLPENVLCRSIRDLAFVDFQYAHELGCTIRQVSRAELRDGKLLAAVEPALVSRHSPLAAVEGGENIIISTGEFGGETVFSGLGAGGNPTAVAVVSDLLQIVRYASPQLAESDGPSATLTDTSSDFEAPQYLRLVVKDSPGILAGLAAVLSKYDINIDAVFQNSGHDKSALPFVITLETTKSSRMEAALSEIKRSSFLIHAPLRMPILN
ncbi:MAG TPA: homoserine dehydrogenase [Terriglobales bacterium]|nr:homoserine dehydrogenase [Terriglobales bacterium]